MIILVVNRVSSFTFALVSASRWLAEIGQLSRREATGKLEAEFDFQRSRCNVFRISVTGMPFLIFYHILYPLRHELGGSVETHKLSILSFFITWCAGSSSTPKQNLFSLGSWKKKLGIHPKRIIIPASFHSKAFVLLYKFETSWALIGRLSRGFFCHLRRL